MISCLLLALLQSPASPVQPQASTQSLLRRLDAGGMRAEERAQILEVLAFREGQLDYQAIADLRHIARVDLLIDYTHCLGRCGPEAVDELRKLADKSHPLVRAEAVYGIVLNDEDHGESYARKVLRSAMSQLTTAKLVGVAILEV